MIIVSKTSGDRLEKLGGRLRQVRMQRGQSMADFSKALGISTAALRSMEAGRPGVPIGQWTEVLRRLKRLGDLEMVLALPESRHLGMHQSHRRHLRHRPARPIL